MMRPCKCGDKWEEHPLFSWKGINRWQCQKCLCGKYEEDFTQEPK